MSMVERVARVIFASSDRERLFPGAHPAFERDQDDWEAMARAAIEAMREPTKLMEGAGDTALENAKEHYDTGDDSYCELIPDGAQTTIYQAMIDAALKDTTP